MLVVGHGTADLVGAEETRQVAAVVSGLLPRVAVELGFLELIGPTIAEGIERLASRGCTEVVAAPLLLFTAGHAMRDVPDAVRDAACKTGLGVRQAEPLGVHPDIVALSRRRREEALTGLTRVSPEETVLLVIGRGSKSPTAGAQLMEFVAATAPTQSRIELGFAAAARPTLQEAVANAASGRVRRVVVQPHLLFRGHVEEQVHEAVREGRRDHPGIEWVQTGRLGADPLVAKALVGRATAIFRDGPVR